MTADEVHDLVTTWLGRVGGVGLVLPSGWFGRPYDNVHRLTWSSARPNRLLLEFDEHVLLTLARPGEPVVSESEFVLPAAQLVFDWQEYGSTSFHADTFSHGELRLVAV